MNLKIHHSFEDGIALNQSFYEQEELPHKFAEKLADFGYYEGQNVIRREKIEKYTPKTGNIAEEYEWEHLHKRNKHIGTTDLHCCTGFFTKKDQKKSVYHYCPIDENHPENIWFLHEQFDQFDSVIAFSRASFYKIFEEEPFVIMKKTYNHNFRAYFLPDYHFNGFGRKIQPIYNPKTDEFEVICNVTMQKLYFPGFSSTNITKIIQTRDEVMEICRKAFELV